MTKQYINYDNINISITAKWQETKIKNSTQSNSIKLYLQWTKTHLYSTRCHRQIRHVEIMPSACIPSQTVWL